MKTTIYELLGMIKNDIFVKRILFKNQVYEYDEDAKDYYNEEYGWIFDEYDLISILNEPVEILETTITYKPDKIEKLSYQQIGSWALEQHNWVDYARAVDKQIQQIGSKINEIIEVLNER